MAAGERLELRHSCLLVGAAPLLRLRAQGRQLEPLRLERHALALGLPAHLGELCHAVQQARPKACEYGE